MIEERIVPRVTHIFQQAECPLRGLCLRFRVFKAFPAAYSDILFGTPTAVPAYYFKRFSKGRDNATPAHTGPAVCLVPDNEDSVELRICLPVNLLYLSVDTNSPEKLNPLIAVASSLVKSRAMPSYGLS